MDRDNQDDLVVVLSGLMGIVVGQALRRRRKGPGQEEGDRFMRIGTSSLVAAPAMARIAGDALRLRRDDTRGQAFLAFLAGAILTLLADEIGRYLPTGRRAGRHAQD